MLIVKLITLPDITGPEGECLWEASCVNGLFFFYLMIGFGGMNPSQVERILSHPTLVYLEVQNSRNFVHSYCTAYLFDPYSIGISRLFPFGTFQ